MASDAPQSQETLVRVVDDDKFYVTAEHPLSLIVNDPVYKLSGKVSKKDGKVVEQVAEAFEAMITSSKQESFAPIGPVHSDRSLNKCKKLRVVRIEKTNEPDKAVVLIHTSHALVVDSGKRNQKQPNSFEYFQMSHRGMEEVIVGDTHGSVSAGNVFVYLTEEAYKDKDGAFEMFRRDDPKCNGKYLNG